ncbi:MAG: hypothetical protein IJU93_09265 [Lachnospiraceae bacterium]|nr:hypothetical protein [Lachnospiraceae bacterium]
MDKKDTDKGLSTEQIKAIDAIDQWFVRNYSNTGLVGWAVGARNHHGEAVSALLGKSKRERLFIYYLIETKKRKNPDISDVYASQADYVPDLEKFKGQMLHTRLKVLSHLSGQYVAMHKLSEATQINREYKELIKDCAEPVAISDKTKLKELKSDKIADRTYMLGEVYQSTKTYRDRAAAFLKKGKKDAKAEAELEALKKKAEADLKELIAADSAVDEAEQYGDITEQGTIGSAQVSIRSNSNSGDLSSNMRYAAKYGARLAGNTGNIVKDALSGANLVKSGVQKVIPSIGGGSWKLKDSILAKTEFFSGTVSVSGISALGSLMATIYGVYNFSRGYSGMHAGDFGVNIVKILNSTASATTTAWKGVQVTQQYIASADSLFNGTIKVSPALQVAGMVTGGVGTGLETYNTLSGMLDCRNASKAASFLNKKERNTGNMDAKQAKFERNMLKVSKDISAKKMGMGGFNTVASGLSMAGLLVPVFGTAITLTGVGLTMASGMVSIFGMDMKGIRKKIFDSYFNFDEFVNKALAVMEARGEKVYNMKEFRRNMRRTLAAAAGFSDVESACDHIGKQYADFICKKLFGEAGERTTDENERKGYIQLVKSFGLPYSEKKKTPSAAALARKMSGR